MVAGIMEHDVVIPGKLLDQIATLVGLMLAQIQLLENKNSKIGANMEKSILAISQQLGECPGVIETEEGGTWVLLT